MNLEHAVQTIAKRGFTDRQARFLVLVARHSGVCVMRQYSSFAGIVFGQKTRKFFANLVRLGLVSTYDCAHNRGRVYHVRHRAIYEAIGEPDSRLRRPPGVPRALERLMLLDAILENPESIWMSSQLVLVEDHFFDRVRRTVQPARVVVDPLRDPQLSIHLLSPSNLARSELDSHHDASADVGAAERASVRPERLADHEITELHSGGPPLSDRNAVIR